MLSYILNVKYSSLWQYDNLTSGDDIVDVIMEILGWSALGSGLPNELDGMVGLSHSICYLPPYSLGLSYTFF